MNKIIKTLSLVLLMCIPVAYGMENKAITINQAPCTFDGLNMIDDALIAIISKYDSLKQIVTSKEVCKNFYQVINNIILPTAFNCFSKQDIIRALNTSAVTKNNDFYTKLLIERLSKDECIIPFKTAIQQGDIHIVKAFLEYGLDPNNSKENGETPLSMAIKADHMDVFKLLLHYDANIFESADKGHSILRMSVEKACPGKLQEYLGFSSGNSVDYYPLMIILQEKYGKTKKAIEATASAATNYCTIL